MPTGRCCSNARDMVLDTNSIEGRASFHGRGTLAGVLDLFRLLQAIQDQYGDVTLHKIKRTEHASFRQGHNEPLRTCIGD